MLQKKILISKKYTSFVVRITLSNNRISGLMHKNEDKKSIIEFCPVRNVIARFGNKWAFLVLLTIHEYEVIRFNELGRVIPDISSRMLSETLRVLEADGLIVRKIYPEVPPRVEYRLTDIGFSLIPIILQLTEWAQKNMKRIMAHRHNFGETSSV